MRTLVTIAGLAVSLSLAAPALAQRALGDGRALDSNLQLGSQGRNAPARDLMREFRLRNAIVTGRAPAGLSFRGDVGYGAEDDFRAPLGEDDLFGFQRDSAFSAITGRGIRGVEALQLQMQLTTGGYMPQGEDYLPDPVIRRQMDATSVDSLKNEGYLDPQHRGRDPLEFNEGVLRSISESVTRRDQRPTLLRVIPGQDEQTPDRYSVATPLRAISEQDEVRSERRLSDLMRVLDRMDTRVESEVPDVQPESNRLEPRRDGRTEAYDRVIQRMLEREEAQGEDARPEPGEQLEPGEREGEAPADEPEVRTGADLAEEPELLAELRELREALMRPDRETPRFGGNEEPDPEEMETAEKIRESIRRAAKNLYDGAPIELDTIAPADDRVDLYSMHMNRGQELLAQGQWFAAEERFTSALGLRPGDPMAAVGRVHAQIGGGMFLSAGLNLQNLFRTNPELIDVRYGESLLPIGQRLDELRGLLNARLRGDDEFSRGAALVKAYLGYQVQRDEWVREGLDRIEEIDAERGRDAATLPTVLRAAWLD
jgi:hypothetical protein